MTANEIADVAGVSVDTVQRKIKELYPELVEARKRTNLNQSQSMGVVKELRKLNFVTPLPQNAADIDSAFKLAIVALTAMTKSLDDRMTKIESRIEQRHSLLPAPQIKPRDNVNKIVREYARHHGIDHPTAFGELYREFGYRTNTDPRRAAKNRSMAIIDYIEAEGMIDMLESVAMEWATK